MDAFENAFTEGRDAITAQGLDYYFWRERNAEGLRVVADVLENGGDIETATRLRQAANTLEWTWNPDDHDEGDAEQFEQQNLGDLRGAIQTANEVLPNNPRLDEQYIENEQNLPELENRDGGSRTVEEEHFDGEPVIQVWNYNTYLRFNTSQVFLYDEYGNLRHDLDTEENMDCNDEEPNPNFRGACNFHQYIGEYEEQNWH